MIVCTKTAFKDTAAIRRHLTRQRRDGKPRKQLARSCYFCAQCDAFHLTYPAKGGHKKH